MRNKKLTDKPIISSGYKGVIKHLSYDRPKNEKDKKWNPETTNHEYLAYSHTCGSYSDPHGATSLDEALQKAVEWIADGDWMGDDPSRPSFVRVSVEQDDERVATAIVKIEHQRECAEDCDDAEGCDHFPKKWTNIYWWASPSDPTYGEFSANCFS